MPPKRGQKRKAVSAPHSHTTNEASALTPPDRNTWPGWVEMESEPAFFNVMLKDMGVRGVKIQEVISMDSEMLAVLPQPVHALIFLFRYHKDDEQQEGNIANTDHIWFANQLPDFACATVALLNIVNNIPSLEMGKELRDFKAFTKDMDPMTKGDMIDRFDFVRRIHNSFARGNDILNADMHTKEKLDRFKRKAAAAKGRATKENKKLAQLPLQETSPNASKTARTSTRATKPTNNAAAVPATPAISTKSRASSTLSTPDHDDGPDGNFDPSAKKASPVRANGIEDVGLRRSGRVPKPRKNVWAVKTEDDVPEAGFHFIAYMPIDDRIWKLDGLDYYPTDIGTCNSGDIGTGDGRGNWIDTVSPTIMNRMLQFQEDTVEFNLMAVVHDPASREKTDLIQNVKALQTIDAKLSSIAEDWGEMDGAETKPDVVTGVSLEFGITQWDIDATILSPDQKKGISDEDGFLELINLRQQIISRQSILRAGLRDSTTSAAEDDEKARQRRHDYSGFIRGWLGALAEQEALGDVLDDRQ